MIYKKIIRPILFSFDSETVHNIITQIFKIIFSIPFFPFFIKLIYFSRNDILSQEFFGIKFKNPVGLAAGFDKKGDLINILSNFGFGFVEIGTITPLAQSGNSKPRMFRLVEDEALINHFGFNNLGIEETIKNLRKKNNQIIVGGNIGKNKLTPNKKANDDYLKCFHALYTYVDYFVINVSSPNTPNLRSLQDKEPLQKLLFDLKTIQKQKKTQKPILLKIAPDLNINQLHDIIQIVLITDIEGVIATNTTIKRKNLKSKITLQEQQGGLSGKPLFKDSTEIIKILRKQLGNEKLIIGVGGIFNGNDAYIKIKAGANLVQIYTGFVYEGPSIIKNINSFLITNVNL